MITAPYIALLVLLGVFLSLGVVRIRHQQQISLGTGDHKPLERAIRAFGNYTEYTPLLIIVLLLVEMQGAPALWLHFLGLGALFGRFAHGAAFQKRIPAALHFRLRPMGMAFTYLVLIIGALTILLQSIGWV